MLKSKSIQPELMYGGRGGGGLCTRRQPITYVYSLHCFDCPITNNILDYLAGSVTMIEIFRGFIVSQTGHYGITSSVHRIEKHGLCNGVGIRQRSE